MPASPGRFVNCTGRVLTAPGNSWLAWVRSHNASSIKANFNLFADSRHMINGSQKQPQSGNVKIHKFLEIVDREWTKNKEKQEYYALCVDNTKWRSMTWKDESGPLSFLLYLCRARTAGWAGTRIRFLCLQLLAQVFPEITWKKSPTEIVYK